MSPRHVARALPVVALIALVAVGASPVQAAPKGWSLPANAREVAPDTYEVASAEVDGRTLTCWAIIHRGHAAKPAGAGGAGKGGNTCYAYLAAGLKWKSVKNYVVDPSVSNSDGSLTSTYVRSVVADAIGQWEDAADGTPDDGHAVQVMGDEVAGTVNEAGIGHIANGVNECCFAPIAEPGVIAVTWAWGYYSGPTKTRELLEWDQQYDDDGNWTWGDATLNAGVMDFANIAAHEIGHAFGMGHPSGTCTHETMYAYASAGELTKRDLDAGDIAGIDNLY
jgi:hypothetical protein